MADITVDFHATPLELLEFIQGVARELRLHAAICASDVPFVILEIGADRLQAYWPVKEMFLFTKPPRLDASSHFNFLEINNGLLSLQIGELTPSGLRQSHLATRCHDAAMFATWKTVANKLRKRTVAGVWVTTEVGRQLCKNWRYTILAMQLENQGTPMLPSAGKYALRLGKDAVSNH